MGEDEEVVAVTVRSKDGSQQYQVSIRRILPGGRLVEPTIELMVQDFIPRETMNSHLGFMSDDENRKGLEEGWRSKIALGNSMAAVLADSYGQDKQPVVIAANITYIVDKAEEDFDIKTGGRALRIIGHALKHISEECNICTKYNVDSYLSAMGLGVNSQYLGLGLGLELLKAREQLCKLLGLTCSATVFTGHVSQHLAAKAGFETVYNIKYNDIVVEGEHVFSNAKPDLYLKLMARTY